MYALMPLYVCVWVRYLSVVCMCKWNSNRQAMQVGTLHSHTQAHAPAPSVTALLQQLQWVTIKWETRRAITRKHANPESSGKHKWQINTYIRKCKMVIVFCVSEGWLYCYSVCCYRLLLFLLLHYEISAITRQLLWLPLLFFCTCFCYFLSAFFFAFYLTFLKRIWVKKKND